MIKRTKRAVVPHPAEGIYYVNTKMLRRLHPCEFRYNQFKKRWGTRDVLVTREFLEWCATAGGMISWMLVMLRNNEGGRNGHITYAEYQRWVSGWGHRTPQAEAQAALDVLAARARREGRIL